MSRYLFFALSIFALSNLFLPSLVSAQDDLIAEKLGLVPDKGSLPVWKKPSYAANADLSGMVKSSSRSVFLVGHPEVGIGTAFVISKEKRLLATNAHVADIMQKKNEMYAVMNETGWLFRVKKIHYHPDVIRKNTSGQRGVGYKPSFGKVDPRCPDLALLVLEDDGRNLPTEFPVAAPSKTYDCFAQPVAMLGFPGYNVDAWPKLGAKPGATYQQGVISRMTDFELNTNVPKKSKKFIQHNMHGWPGNSGSPIFNRKGEVIGVHNSGRHVQRSSTAGKVESVISHSIRADALWFLIRYCGYEKHVQGNSENIPVFAKTPYIIRDDKLEQAIKLEKEIVALRRRVGFTKSFLQTAESKARKMISLAPNYYKGYLQLSLAKGSLAARYGNRGAAELELYKSAAANAKIAIQKAPSEYHSYCDYITQTCNVANVANNINLALDMLDLSNQILKKEMPKKDEAYIWHAKSVAYWTAAFAGDKSFRDSRLRDSLRAESKAIELFPKDPNFFRDRSMIYEKLGMTTEASRDKAKYKQLIKTF